MKKLFVILLCCISCGTKPKNEIEAILIPDSVYSIQGDFDKAGLYIVRDHPTLDTFVLGYFDKDRIKDTAFLYGPMDSLHDEMFGCWPCSTYVIFSNGSKGFGREDIGTHLENLGDLDKDGIDEIGRLTDWFVGGWTTVMIFKNVNNEWIYAASTEMYHPIGPFTIKSIIKNLGNGKILLYGDHTSDPEPTESIFDLKADTLPCLVSEKKFEE